MPKSERIVRSEEDVRDATIAAALEAFFSGGYSQTTADALAKVVGVSKKTLYRLFTSKEGLMLFAARRVMKSIEAATDPCYHDHHRPVIERISALVNAITPHYAAIRSPDMLLDMKKNAPRVWEELETWRQRRYALFRSIIEDGIRNGELRSDLPVDDIQAFYVVLVNKIMDHRAIEDSGVTPAELYRTFMSIFLNGLLTTERPPCDRTPSFTFPVEDRILATAEQLFDEFGYVGTTSDRIAQSLGMSKKTLYERYATKESLVIALFVQAARDANERASKLTFRTSETFLDEIHTLMGIYGSTLRRFSPIFLKDVAQYLPRLRRWAVAWQRWYLTEHIGRSLRVGMEIGRIRFDVDVTAATSVVRLSAVNAFDHVYAGNGITPLREEVVCSILFSGIVQRTGRSPQPPTR